MRSIHQARDVLARETAHLTAPERAQVAAMVADATAFAAAHPVTCVASPDVAREAIALKLLTLHEGAERWVRQLVARAAIEAEASASWAA